ncbi:MAG: carbon storage regulator CsrA [Defluviitaleaceae bacterium]|nr:carbon storage regulator CsrA [Defluviitaleaceae bacterium]
MLALTRKKGESIMVGTDVEVIVIGVQGEQVKLGFVAPKNVAIHRKEIYEQIQSENRTASSNINLKALTALEQLKM